MGATLSLGLEPGAARREKTLVKQELPELDTVPTVDLQDCNGGASDRGASREDRTFPSEVPFPPVPARMK